jgi:hypothetical protein
MHTLRIYRAAADQRGLRRFPPEWEKTRRGYRVAAHPAGGVTGPPDASALPACLNRLRGARRDRHPAARSAPFWSITRNS